MGDMEEARQRIGVIAGELKEVRSRLLNVQDTLPSSDSSKEDIVGDLSPPSEVRAILECLVRDCLDPLIRDLRALAEEE